MSCAWKNVVMIPKGGGTDFRVIVLVEGRGCIDLYVLPSGFPGIHVP